MKFICIMGRSNSGKSTIEKKLEQLGFKRSISYTSKEPQIRNGEIEKNGDTYRFVSRDRFMELVNKGKIIEYAEYNGNLYGTPRPSGAKKYVAVVEINGFKALKELFGDQVIGIYLKCDEDIAIQRSIQRDGSDKLIKSRQESDEKMLNEMESLADAVIDSNKDINTVLADILKVLRNKEEKINETV